MIERHECTFRNYDPKQKYLSLVTLVIAHAEEIVNQYHSILSEV